MQLADYTAMVEKLADAEAQTDAERQAHADAENRATQAETRLQALEAELRRLRGDDA